MDLLFFSRGRGRGHAIPDMAIMQKIVQQRPNLDWSFVSYSTGAETLRSFGYSIHDLQLPEENQFLETLRRAFEVIERCKPRLIVAHEEVAVLLAAKLLRIPSLFLTDWFLNESSIFIQPLEFTEFVFFLERRGVFDEPSYIKDKVQYLGPLVREMTYSRNDRSRARDELGLSKDAIVIACMPGGWATESRAPIAKLLIDAFENMRGTEKKIFWVAGRDCEILTSSTKTCKDIVVIEQLWPIEKLMVACDLVITKGNRGTIMEASSLGIPSISISHGLNPVEDYIVPRIASNLPLRVKGLTSDFLTSCIENQILDHTKVRCESSPTADLDTVSSALIAQFARWVI